MTWKQRKTMWNLKKALQKLAKDTLKDIEKREILCYKRSENFRIEFSLAWRAYDPPNQNKKEKQE